MITQLTVLLDSNVVYSLPHLQRRIGSVKNTENYVNMTCPSNRSLEKYIYTYTISIRLHANNHISQSLKILSM